MFIFVNSSLVWTVIILDCESSMWSDTSLISGSGSGSIRCIYSDYDVTSRHCEIVCECEDTNFIVLDCVWIIKVKTPVSSHLSCHWKHASVKTRHQLHPTCYTITDCDCVWIINVKTLVSRQPVTVSVIVNLWHILSWRIWQRSLFYYNTHTESYNDTAMQQICIKKTAESRKVQKCFKRVRFPEDCKYIAACSSADTEEAKKSLIRGMNVNTQNQNGMTGLHLVSALLLEK